MTKKALTATAILGTLATLSLAAPAYASQVKAVHAGSQCFAVLFDDDPQWYGIAQNVAASPPYTNANITQAVVLSLAFRYGSPVSYVLTGRTIQCKLAFGNGGMIPEISNIDE